MKTQEEIEKLARIYENYNPNDSEIAQAESGGCYHGYKKGYTQCQEDMADKKYTEEDIINIVNKSRETGLTAEYLILQLNKQD
jgi:hypothetical protein